MRGLPAIPQLGSVALPQTPRKPRRVQRAPREFTFPQEGQHYGGPGDPPPDFVGAKNSQTEWPPYWGFAVIFGEPSPSQVRHGPYLGAPGIWEYQEYIPGNSSTLNIDFVVEPTNGLAPPTAFRVQTEFIHNFPADHEKYAYDLFQRQTLEHEYEVVDLYDYMFMGDPTGRSIIQLLKAGMGLIQPPIQPLIGQARRVPS